MNSYKRWNNIVGWIVFAIAAMTYLLTMEPLFEPVGLLRIHRYLV